MSRYIGSSLARLALGAQCGALLLISVACVDDASNETNTHEGVEQHAPKLLAQVKNGLTTVSYHQLTDGTVVETQKGKLDDDAVQGIGNDLSFVERYELLSGSAAPAALIEAEAAADVAGDEAGQAGADEGIAPTSSQSIDKIYGPAPSEHWFMQSYCLQTDRFYKAYRRTALDSRWWGTGTNYVKAGVFVHSGSLEYEFTWTGFRHYSPDLEGLEMPLVLYANDYAGFRVKSTVDRSASSNIRYALQPDDIYTHCVNWHY